MITQNNNKILLYLISFIAGITLSNAFSINPYIFIFGLAILGLTYLFATNINFKFTIKIISLFLLGSILLIRQKQNHQKQKDLISNKTINITCTVINKETNRSSRIKEEILLDIKKITNLDKELFEKAFNSLGKLKIKIYSYKRTRLNPGQLILIKNIFIKNKNVKPDFEKYLIKENIATTFFGNNFEYEIIKENKNSFRAKIANLKKNIYFKLKNKIPKKSFSYFSAIFLGKKKEEITYKDKNDFNIWGISHYLARSGLHIVIFILIWQILFSFLPLNIKFRNILLSLIVITYLSLSWETISILRAFYVFIFFQISKLTNRRANFIQILSLVCFILLLINPIQLFFLDFQLTFFLTFALALANNPK